MSRHFLVVCRNGDRCTLNVEGIEELARVLEVPVEEIPLIPMWKYTFKDHTVYDVRRNDEPQ